MLVCLLLTSAAFAGDFVIVPGRRIGSVALGMDRVVVSNLLHAPSTTHHLSGVVIDTWLSHQLLTANPSGNAVGLKRDYLTVFFRRGRAVQIEVSAAKFKTAGGLSTRSSASDFVKRYPSYLTPHFAVDISHHLISVEPYDEYAVTGDPLYSSPAGKHFLAYGDSVKQGIAWKYGAWADLAPDPDPNGSLEAVIVHVPGQTVMLNPNDGRTYSGTGPARK